LIDYLLDSISSIDKVHSWIFDAFSLSWGIINQ